jgi:hypothetical protein
MKSLLQWVVVAACLVAMPAAADPLCTAVDNVNFDSLAADLAAVGCSPARDGAHKIVANCPKDQPFIRTFRGLQNGSEVFVLAVVPNDSGGPSARLKDCKRTAHATTLSLPDNPIVAERVDFGDGVYAARIAVGDEPAAILFISKRERYSLGSAFERDLTFILSAMYEAPLNFDSSEVRVAGLDITSASIDQLLLALEGRGAKTIETKTFAKGFAKRQLEPPVGLPGVTKVLVDSFGRSVVMIEYRTPAQADYMRFVGELDEKYGASRRETVKGCVKRYWFNGGAFVIGQFCAASPDQSGISFYNDGALITFNRYVGDRSGSAGKPAPTLDDDMF